MAKFENDLDIKRATAEAKRYSKQIMNHIAKNKQLDKAIDILEANKNVVCYVFSKSIAFRVGRSSIKSVTGFSSGFKSSFPSGVAKTNFIPLKIPSNGTNLTKYHMVQLAALYFMLKLPNRFKTESDKTEAVESEQVLKTQENLKKLIREYGSVRLLVGDEYFDVDNFSQVSGRPKADMVFTKNNQHVVFVSHKKGSRPADFQQYGGFASDLEIKTKEDAKRYPEIYKFLNDLDFTLGKLNVGKDSQDRYDLNYLRKGSNFARMIYDEEIAYTVMFGKDYLSKKPGLNNCSILIDGDIIFKPIKGKGLNVFKLEGSYHTKVNPVLEKRKTPFKCNPSDVYCPVMFIIKSEQQGLKQAGLTNARAVIWPNNKVAQSYTKQFEDIFKGVKSNNSSRIKALKEEYKK